MYVFLSKAIVLIVQAFELTEMNIKAPKILSINSSLRVSNLEYVFSIKLIYNDLIFAHFYCYSPDAKSYHMFFDII